MDVDRAIRERRTVKEFAPEPLEPSVVEELVELATWAPDHNLGQRWRFRLLGPEATKVLVDVAPADKKRKQVLAQTRLLVSVQVAGDPAQRTEDLLAAAAATQNVLLAATARGLASFWQSPNVAALKAARNLLGIPEDEELIGVLHLGAPAQERTPPPRRPLADVYSALP